jgi:mannose-6-phosphate isomerase-like protein (cupin superfamily)
MQLSAVSTREPTRVPLRQRREVSTMFIRELKDCAEFTAGDNCLLREILHPGKEDLKLRYSLAHALVKPGLTTWKHRLRTSEVYYIIEGEGIMHIDNESSPVRPGSTVYIPPGAVQSITNSGNADLKFICIVDPAWRKEDEEVLTKGSIML